MKPLGTLFTHLVDESKGMVPFDSLRVEFRAGGLSSTVENAIIARLAFNGLDYLQFVDFLVGISCVTS